MSNICIIPARGGSHRIPGKNIKEFYGKPIISYSIAKAQQSGLFDRIIVSTDDQEIADIAVYWGAEVWRRGLGYGIDCVGTQAVVKECLDGIGAEGFDNVCCLYATAPLMNIKDLCHGYLLITSAGVGVVDFAMSVGYPNLHDAAQFYWGKAFAFMDELPLISDRTRLVLVDADRVCDINTPDDWDRAINMYGRLE